MTPEVGDYDERPWGRYDVVDVGTGFVVKRLAVKGGQRLSYQRHRHRAEHWYVVAGSGTVTLDDVQHQVEPGSTVDIPVGMHHRVSAGSDTDQLVFIEVQTGDYLGDDDIERLEDDYGR